MLCLVSFDWNGPAGVILGLIVGILGIVAGIAGSIVFYRKGRRDSIDPFGEIEAEKDAAFQQKATARAARELIETSLYAHLAAKTARDFSSKFVAEFSRLTRRDDVQLVKLTRLFIEQVYVDCAKRERDDLDPDPAGWPRQTLEAHRVSLDQCFRRAEANLRDLHVHEIVTAFTLHRLQDDPSRVERYFTALRTLELPDGVVGPRDRFLSQIRCKSGFVAPLLLLRGLLASVDADWPRALATFRSAVGNVPLPQALAKSRPDLHLQHVAAFQFYCWLLWGPSIQMCSCPAWQGGDVSILQYGYGDENNSLYLIFDDNSVLQDSWRNIRDSLVASERPYPLAVQTALTATPMWGGNSDVENVPPVYDPEGNAAGLKRMGLLLRCTTTLTGADLLGTQVPYYSAYLWVMFEICDPNHRLGWVDEPWKHYMPIFEHANIADGTAMVLLKEQLAKKALSLIGDLEERFPKVGGGPAVYFRYVCAVDDPSSDKTRNMHDLRFQMRDAASDRIPAFLEMHANDEMRKRLFEQASPESRNRLESSCDLPVFLRSFDAGPHR